MQASPSVSEVQCPSCRTMVRVGSTFCPHCGLALGAVTQPDPMLGQIVAHRYRVLEVIGRGGMGVVYRGEHVETHHSVAIKLLHASLAQDPEFSTRFQQEARVISLLKHPACVRVEDISRRPDGSFIIVMEFVDGRPLSRWLHESKRLTASQVVAVAKGVAEGLEHAHSHRILHRDIKPDNIMINQSASGRLSVRILDFGIAKHLDDDLQTQAGLTYGTPEYMSPEQARGVALDARSDLYSLGVVLYEMIAGRPPFRGKDKRQVAASHIRDAPVPLHDQAGPEIPAELVELVGWLMQKEPSDRPANAAEVLGRLEQIGAELMVKAGNGAARAGGRVLTSGASPAVASGSRPAAVAASRGPRLDTGPVLETGPTLGTGPLLAGADDDEGWSLGPAAGGPVSPVEPSIRARVASRRGVSTSAPASEPGDGDEDWLTMTTGGHASLSEQLEVISGRHRTVDPMSMTLEDRPGRQPSTASRMPAIFFASVGIVMVLGIVGGIFVYADDPTLFGLLSPPEGARPVPAEPVVEDLTSPTDPDGSEVAADEADPLPAVVEVVPEAAAPVVAATAAGSRPRVARTVDAAAAPEATAPTPAVAAPTPAAPPQAAAPTPPAPIVAAVDAPTPAPAAPANTGLDEARAAITAGRLDDARRLVAAAADAGATADAVAPLQAQLALVDTLDPVITAHLDALECVPADTLVIRLRDEVSTRVAARYYGRLDACRAAARSAQRPASSGNTNTAPAPTPTPSPAPTRTNTAGTPGRVLPPREL